MTETLKANKTTKKDYFKWAKHYNSIREENTEKYKWLNLALLILFPIFIACMAEINQFKKVSSFANFVAERPSVILFDITAAGIIFILLLAAFRKGWIAAAIQSFVYMALSITELFKYGTNGNHLILSDMKLVKSVKSLKSFAYIRITPALIIYCAIVVAVVLLIFHFNPVLPHHVPFKRAVAGIVCSILCTGM
ncbi:MAG: LTA synthase family protein, partial [Ruminococcus sp.]|nr:LTA synthase family protein [Ruminococcus sp.]